MTSLTPASQQMLLVLEPTDGAEEIASTMDAERISQAPTTDAELAPAVAFQ